MEVKTFAAQDSELKTALQQRGESLSDVGLRDLKRYYALLNHELLEIVFTSDEASLICQILKEHQFKDDLTQLEALWHQIDRAIQQNQPDQPWSVNREALALKLQNLTLLQRVALVDAVERYWVQEPANLDESLQTKLLRVDLIKCCDSAL